MNEFDKIIELLEKSELNNNEKDLLNDIINKNQETKEFYELYLKLSKSIKNNYHIDEELMGQYVLLLNDHKADTLIFLLKDKIANHLRKCSKCEKLFKEFNSEYTDIDEFIKKTVTDKSQDENVSSDIQKPFSKSILSYKYLFASITAVAIIYVGLYLSTSFVLPDYKKSFLDNDEFYLTRGSSSESFTKGLNSLENEDYNDAIKWFKDDIQLNPNNSSAFYTYYMLGLAYVTNSESSVLGLFKSFNEKDVRIGIKYLKMSIEKNDTENFESIKLDGYYYLARAYLLVDELKFAKENLNIVIENKGGFYLEAERLLKELNNP